jgi:hypothetical protein
MAGMAARIRAHKHGFPDLDHPASLGPIPNGGLAYALLEAGDGHCTLPGQRVRKASTVWYGSQQRFPQR